jgi:uncharacterized repeat protein (TIGR02543 family)
MKIGRINRPAGGILVQRIKIISWVAGFIVLIAVLLCSNRFACAWSGGEGTELSPYLISNTTDLKDLATAVDVDPTPDNLYFRQTADIVFTASDSFNAIGNTYRPFQSTYDGAGFTISGIKINKSSSDWKGLFGGIGAKGTVKNVNLKSSIIQGRNCVGGICGENKGRIENCSSIANQITGTSCVGGIAGENKGRIENCSSIANQITGTNHVGGLAGKNINNPAAIEFSYSSSQVNGVTQVGGAVGTNNYALVKQCWSTGEVTASGEYYAGGICGYNFFGTIQDSYNTGIINGGTKYTGGIAGGNISGTVRNCCNYAAVSGSNYTGGIIGEYIPDSGGTVANNYFLQSDTINASLYGIASPQGSNGAEARTGCAMQSDAFAYVLNMGTSTANSTIWSRNPGYNNGFPHLADKNNLGICKVIYMNNGVTYAEGYSSYTGLVSFPLKPTQAGYIFGGWYTDNNGEGAAFTADSLLTQDLIVYAYWFADPGNMPAFEMINAEKRIDSPQGLRFKTRLYKNSLFYNNRIKEYGTVILPFNLIPAGQTLTLETIPANYHAENLPDSKIAVIQAVNIFAENDDYLVFTGVLTNIPTDCLATDITACAYVKYVDTDNTEKIIYSQPLTSSYNSASDGQ